MRDTVRLVECMAREFRRPRGRDCLGEGDTGVSFPLKTPVFITVLESSSTLEASNVVGTRTVRDVPFHVLVKFHGGRTRLLKRSPAPCVRLYEYKRLEICHGFKYEQEKVFSYKSCALVEEHESGLWVVAYRSTCFAFARPY